LSGSVNQELTLERWEVEPAIPTDTAVAVSYGVVVPEGSLIESNAMKQQLKTRVAPQRIVNRFNLERG